MLGLARAGGGIYSCLSRPAFTKFPDRSWTTRYSEVILSACCSVDVMVALASPCQHQARGFPPRKANAVSQPLSERSPETASVARLPNWRLTDKWTIRIADDPGPWCLAKPCVDREE